MRVRAAILRESGLPKPYAQSRPISIEEIDLAPPGSEEVLVKMAGAGVCHSDLSGINGDRPRSLPVALGHEASGVIEEIGPNVRGLAPGDHVVMSFLPVCGTCPMCATGRASLCIPGGAANAAGTLINGARRITCDGATINHHSGVCAFSEYSVIHTRSVTKVTKDIDIVEAALFGCAVMTGVGAVMNTCGVRPGESVAVIGLGGVGLSAILGAVAAGAGRVVAVDLLASKLALAKTLGATDAFDASGPDVIEEIKAATGGGVDYAIEMAGSPKALELGYAITRRGGTTATAGLSRVGSEFRIPAVSLVADERVVRGSYMGSCVPSRDIPRYIDLFLQGRLPVDKLLSRIIKLEEINEAFDALDRGEVVRQIVRM